MHIILTGATGTVGHATLRTCLASSKVTRLSILSRREFSLPEGDGLDSSKAKIIVHKDFNSYPVSLTEELKDADGCIWAQGISQTQVSKDEYIKITYDYPLAAAKAFATLSNKFNFVYVSGEGADQAEKASTLFGKIKGRTERALRQLPSEPSLSSLHIFNVRPGFVDPVPETYQAASFPKRMLWSTSRVIAKAMPSMHSPALSLGQVLVDLATGDGNPLAAGPGVEDEGRLVRSVGIRRLQGL